MKNLIKSVLFLLTLSLASGIGGLAFAQDDEIVASLQRIEGSVKVIQAKEKDTISGRKGLLLRDGDTIVTAAKARATIKFRDGSEIRLFQKTTFQVQAQEAKGKDRFFKVNLFMKLGSFWGNFAKQKQIAQIGTPTATIGIKGTTLRVVDRDGTARVSLTEGLIDVKNDRTTVELVPGKRLTDFTSTDDLDKKIADIPYTLEMKSEKKKLTFPGNSPEEVFITIQMVDIKSGGNVSRNGKLYLRSNYDRISYPKTANLDNRGFTRVGIKVHPPETSDAELRGNVYVWAVVDQENADDTKEGTILIKIPVPQGKERVKVDAKTGKGKRQN